LATAVNASRSARSGAAIVRISVQFVRIEPDYRTRKQQTHGFLPRARRPFRCDGHGGDDGKRDIPSPRTLATRSGSQPAGKRVFLMHTTTQNRLAILGDLD